MKQQAAFSGYRLFQVMCCVVLLVFFSALAVNADIYCDPQIKARAQQDRQNAIMKDIARFETAYGSSNSFNGLYCGSQINSEFNQIGNSLVGSLDSQINCLINNVFQNACKAAISPVQNAATQSCTPNFTQSYFDQNLINSVFNQNSNTRQSDPTQALICLVKLIVISQTTDIHLSDVTNCLYGTLSQTDVINCLLALFAQGRNRVLTQNDLSICLAKSANSNRPNYCPGTQLQQLLQFSPSPGFSGGGSSYPSLFW